MNTQLLRQIWDAQDTAYDLMNEYDSLPHYYGSVVLYQAEAYIVEQAYDPVYGARPLKRYIQKYVETLSAKLILEDAVSQGDTIVITVQDGHLAAGVSH